MGRALALAQAAIELHLRLSGLDAKGQPRRMNQGRRVAEETVAEGRHLPGRGQTTSSRDRPSPRLLMVTPRPGSQMNQVTKGEEGEGGMLRPGQGPDHLPLNS